MKLRPNILFITADDMNWDAVGACGCPVVGTTPNLDCLAAEGMRFDRGHVTISVCQPSRSALMTGRYPHRSGGEGFFRLSRPGVPILPELLRQVGYRVGILGKVAHSTPYADFEWDLVRDFEELGFGRNPGAYGARAEAFLREAGASEQPFFLMVNAHDPHRPFFGNDRPEWYAGEQGCGAVRPSRVFSPEEVVTPGFLPDLPEVRLEIAEYYSSVRRCDDTVGSVLEALRQAGQERNTLVVFLSDNGMAFPFSKTNCYLHSTKTPLLVRWPGVVSPGSVDSRHFVSGVDFLPTFLEAAGIETPPKVDGRSFLDLLRGEVSRLPRDRVFTQFHQTHGRRNYPIRCVQNHQFGYIFNPWSNGEREFRNESQSGRTMAAMQAAAEDDPATAERVRFFLHRVPEEFYDFSEDPDARHNRIDDTAFKEEIETLRAELLRWMEETEDPAVGAFRNRECPEARESFLRWTEENLGTNRTKDS